MPFGDEKVTQFLGFPPTSVSYIKVCEIRDLSLLILKINFLLEWACKILERDKQKNKAKTGKNAQFPRALKGDFYHLSLNGKKPASNLPF